MVGIPIPPKEYTPRARGKQGKKATKEEKHRRKNEYNKEETRRKANALGLIKRHLGIEGATEVETLAALVKVGEYWYHPNSAYGSWKADASCFVVKAML